jgi:hypothetical protein
VLSQSNKIFLISALLAIVSAYASCGCRCYVSALLNLGTRFLETGLVNVKVEEHGD